MMTAMSDRPRNENVNALAELAERVRELEQRAGNERRRIGAHDRDLARIGPQVAALEERVEVLHEQRQPSPSATAAEVDEARSLLEDVRREHAQVRVRVTSVVRYEERIRQLEDEVAALRAETAQPAPKN